jgi:DHA3 family macrolide efflux protein-like MFS transporter
MRRFAIIWSGQVASLVGSAMTWFALGVWIYQQTGSTMLFALALFSATLPQVILLPVAGVWVDRLSRRRILMCGDICAAALALGMATLFYLDRFEVWHVYVANALGSCVAAFKTPAFIAATASLVPKEKLARASGMSSSGHAVSQMIAPLLGALLLRDFGVGGVVLIDLATFMVSLFTLSIVEIPDPPRVEQGGRRSLMRDATFGVFLLARHPGLKQLVLYFVLLNFTLNLSWVAITPTILKSGTPQALGSVMSAGNAGMLVSGVLMAVWGGPTRRINGVLMGGMLFGLSLLVLGSSPHIVIIAVALGGLLFSVPIINSCFRSIWQSGMPPEAHGRVSATILMLVRSSVPFAFLVGGYVIDSVFEPLLLPGGILERSAGPLLGTGPGRGTGLMLIVLGTLSLAATFACTRSNLIRNVEDSRLQALDPGLDLCGS